MMTDVAEVRVTRVNNQIYVLVDNLTPLKMPQPDLVNLHQQFVTQVRERSPEKCKVTVEGEYRKNTDQWIHVFLVLPPPTNARMVQEVAHRLQIFSEHFWETHRNKLKTPQVA